MSKKPEQASTIGDLSGLAVLDDLARTFATRVKKTTWILKDGSVLTRTLRARYREHEIQLVCNQELMLTWVEAKYGQFTLFVVNPDRRLGIRFSPTGRTLTAAGRSYKISSHPAKLSRAQSDLVASGALESILEVAGPRDGEEINISQELVTMFVQRPTRERVMAFVDAVVDFMPHEMGRKNQFEFEGLPDSLRPLIPLLAKWAVSDDDERWRKLERCAQSTRQRLVSKVVPLLPDIDKYLGSLGKDPPEEACAFGDLAQAALEAQSLIAEPGPR